jgi:uncharacterized protein (DUF1684 family)
MKTKLIGTTAVIVVISSLVALYLLKEQSSYIATIEGERREKEIWMSNSLESPFNIKQVTFKGLNYFEPTTAYRVEADFKKSVATEQVRLITNDGAEQVYDVYGVASFTIDGQPCSVQVLTSEELGTSLFIPFRDKTSGDETYGAGRYLEAMMPTSSTIELDFNRAYNPYCAYMDGYTCPFPPKANVLPVEIRAGEKVY